MIQRARNGRDDDGPVGCAVREHAGAQREQRDAQETVDEEDCSPTQAERSDLQKQAGCDGATDGGQGQQWAEQGEHAAELLTRKHPQQDAESLGDEQRPEDALHEPERDQRRWRPRGSDSAGRDREPGEIDQEGATVTEAVSEATADDQQRTERERVAQPEPRHQGGRSVEVADDRWGSDIRDRRIEQVEDVGHQDSSEDPPA